MNQSDIRGLSLRDRAYIDILRRKLCVLRSWVRSVWNKPII